MTVHKPHRQVRGEGVAQMSTVPNKSYIVKGSTKGGGGSKMPQILSTWFVHSPYTNPSPLALNFFEIFSFGENFVTKILG